MVGHNGNDAMLASAATSHHDEPGLPVRLAKQLPVVSMLKNMPHAAYGMSSGFCVLSHARSVAGSAGRASLAGVSASASVSPVANRPPGSRTRQRSIAAPSTGGIPGAARITLGAASVD